MTTQTQTAANRANAQHSTGPKTSDGISRSSMNNFRHGLAGAFMIPAWESQQEFDELSDALHAEHAPSTPTEVLLVERMAQHFWLTQRAIRLQNKCLEDGFPTSDDDRGLPLYLRYQLTHDRAFHKSLNALLKLRAEKRKAEIGFESQERKRNEEAHKQADQTRREAAENRKQELHRYNVLLGEAKFEHQDMLNFMLRRSAPADPVVENRPLTAEKAA
jgi:hypothetical protein